jgi:hypothetical protein
MTASHHLCDLASHSLLKFHSGYILYRHDDCNVDVVVVRLTARWSKPSNLRLGTQSRILIEPSQKVSGLLSLAHCIRFPCLYHLRSACSHSKDATNNQRDDARTQQPSILGAMTEAALVSLHIMHHNSRITRHNAAMPRKWVARSSHQWAVNQWVHR